MSKQKPLPLAVPQRISNTDISTFALKARWQQYVHKVNQGKITCAHLHYGTSSSAPPWVLEAKEYQLWQKG